MAHGKIIMEGLTAWFYTQPLHYLASACLWCGFFGRLSHAATRRIGFAAAIRIWNSYFKIGIKSYNEDVTVTILIKRACRK